MAAPVQNLEIKDVVLQIPAAIRCTNCLKGINRGTKFSSRKEELPGEYFARKQLFKFLFNCSECSGEIAIKSPAESDLRNTFLRVVAGAKPVYEFVPFDNIIKSKRLILRFSIHLFTRTARGRRADNERQQRKFEEIGDAVKSLDVEGEMD